MITLRSFRTNTSGSAAVEFGLTAPGFFAMIFVLIGVAMLIWAQVAVQHAAGMAARCRSVNTTLCATVADTQAYAATQTLGLAVPAGNFAVTTPSCGVQVTGTYNVLFITTYIGVPSFTVTGRSCFPT